MPAAESKHERIAAALATLLAGITTTELDGAGVPKYHYAPDAVARVKWFDERDLAKEYEGLILIRADPDVGSEEAAQTYTQIADFTLVYARQAGRAVTKVFDQDIPIAPTVSARLIRDMKRRIVENYKLAGIAENTEVVNEQHDVAWPGWDLGVIEIQVTYSWAVAEGP